MLKIFKLMNFRCYKNVHLCLFDNNYIFEINNFKIKFIYNWFKTVNWVNGIQDNACMHNTDYWNVNLYIKYSLKLFYI